ncbi:MAG: hypothetical protein ACRDY2_13840 [Acidimicrobiales bacterium]
MNRDRKPVLLRFDPAVHDALARWASDELRSLNAQVELLLRRALKDAGRMPKNAGSLPRRGRPPGQGRHGGQSQESDDEPGQIDETEPRHCQARQ